MRTISVAVFALAGAASALHVVRPVLRDTSLRLIKTSPTEPATWMTEEETDKLAAEDARFIDITDITVSDPKLEQESKKKITEKVFWTDCVTFLLESLFSELTNADPFFFLKKDPDVLRVFSTTTEELRKNANRQAAVGYPTKITRKAEVDPLVAQIEVSKLKSWALEMTEFVLSLFSLSLSLPSQVNSYERFNI
jgi:hypothetical protein